MSRISVRRLLSCEPASRRANRRKALMKRTRPALPCSRLVALRRRLPARMPRAQKPSAAGARSSCSRPSRARSSSRRIPEEAPKTVARIVELVKKNFYNGLRFHRAEANFLVQIGDPASRDMSQQATGGDAAGQRQADRRRRRSRRSAGTCRGAVGDGACRRSRSSPTASSTSSCSRDPGARRQVHRSSAA